LLIEVPQLARRVSHSTTAAGATAEIIITFRNELVSVCVERRLPQLSW
jgi:hypothetical protein